MRMIKRKCFGILLTGIACAVAPSCSQTETTVVEPVDEAFSPLASSVDISGQAESCECPVCGNKKVEMGEECDDGNTTSGDGCSAECKKEEKPCPPVCGNNKVEIGEECDDGNTTSGDGCSSKCKVEKCIPETGDMIIIWPPNHKYEQFDLSDCAKCTGKGDIDVVGTITSICSDEPEDEGGEGDGNTEDDIVILSDSSFKVRAERQGAAEHNGRVYTVEFTVTGSTETFTCLLGVPHSGPNDTPVNDPGAGYCVANPL